MNDITKLNLKSRTKSNPIRSREGMESAMMARVFHNFFPIDRVLVAKRNIEAGEVIFGEYPLVFGPAKNPSCPTCLQCLRKVKISPYIFSDLCTTAFAFRVLICTSVPHANIQCAPKAVKNHTDQLKNVKFYPREHLATITQQFCHLDVS